MIRLLHLSCSVVVVGVSSFWPLPGAGQTTPRTPTTETEAHQIVERVLQAIEQPGKMPPEFRADLFTPLIGFLAAPDPRVRAIGLRAFTKVLALDSEVQLDDCLPHLAAERPIEQRVVLLALCLNGGLPVRGAEHEALMERAAPILRSEVCPPRFDLLTLVLARGHSVWVSSDHGLGIDMRAVVPEAARTQLARRLLASRAGALETLDSFGPCNLQLRWRDPELAIFNAILALGEPHAGQAVEDWYRAEPNPAMRRIVVDKRLSWSGDLTWATRRKAILVTASKDWDPAIARQAQLGLAP